MTYTAEEMRIVAQAMLDDECGDECSFDVYLRRAQVALNTVALLARTESGEADHG